MLFLWLLIQWNPTASANPCYEKATKLVVSSQNHRLYLCEPPYTAPIAYRVSLGTHGIGKRALGDHKTPLGVYSLGSPRSSHRFHLFIPIGYPTPEQIRKGFTGADIGLHGPPRWIAWWGEITRLIDWTDGCIAVGTDREIEKISSWIKARNPKTIDIR